MSHVHAINANTCMTRILEDQSSPPTKLTHRSRRPPSLSLLRSAQGWLAQTALGRIPLLLLRSSLFTRSTQCRGWRCDDRRVIKLGGDHRRWLIGIRCVHACLNRSLRCVHAWVSRKWETKGESTMPILRALPFFVPFNLHVKLYEIFLRSGVKCKNRRLLAFQRFTWTL